MPDNNNHTQTSTQIRNFYSDGMSYMNVKFYNTSLSFQLYPFISKDQTGRSTYDTKNGQTTTVGYDGAYAIYDTASKILEGKIEECNLPIPCASGATITLERKMSQNGFLETYFNITKNNMTIPFRFQTATMQVKENGQIVSKIIETGLGAFAKTVEGYLNGINADRHLDKLTEDFAKLQNGGNGNNQQQGGGFNNNYRSNGNGNGGYRKYNNYNNRKPYNNQQFGQQQGGNGWGGAPAQQNISTYQIKN